MSRLARTVILGALGLGLGLALAARICDASPHAPGDSTVRTPRAGTPIREHNADAPLPEGTKPPSQGGKPVVLGAGGQSRPTDSEEVDATALALAWNAKPDGIPTAWKKGHVTPRRLDPSATTRSSSGFVVQFPSRTPVPTPTIADGRLFVGGGFSSKEFYCFDVRTGELQWGVNTDDDGPSSAVVEDGVVVFNTESCTIFALDVNTGQQLWSWWLGDPLVTTPAIHHGKVYTSYPCAAAASHFTASEVQQPDAKLPMSTRPSHVLACFELRTGRVLWQRWIDSDVVSSPVVTGEEVYATTFAGTVYKLHAASGKILSARQCRATSAPVLSQGESYFTRRVDQDPAQVREAILASVVGGSGEGGRLMNDKEAVYLDSLVQRQTAFFAASSKNDAANGFTVGAPAAAQPTLAMANIGVASVSSMQAFQGSRIAHFAGLNYNTMGNEVVCTDPRRATKLWSYPLAGDLKNQGGCLGTSPAIASGDLFVGTLGGKVLRIDGKNGKMVKSYHVGSPVRFQPAVVDGQIAVGTQDGKVVCIDTGEAKLTGWSTWGGNAAHTGVAR